MRKPVKCWHTFSIIKQELCWNPILRNKVIIYSTLQNLTSMVSTEQCKLTANSFKWRTLLLQRIFRYFNLMITCISIIMIWNTCVTYLQQVKCSIYQIYKTRFFERRILLNGIQGIDTYACMYAWNLVLWQYFENIQWVTSC